MTPRQNDVYLIIDEYWKRFGYGPTVEDVMDQLGIRSRKSAHRMMTRLVEMGACKREHNKTRSIRPSHLKFRNI